MPIFIWFNLLLPKVMCGFLNKVNLIITDGLTKEHCIGAYLFACAVRRLGKKSGWLFTALYWKQCASSLQKAYGGVHTKNNLLPVKVSLTRSGSPRIIPSFNRIFMYKKDERAELYLSFFRLAKIVTLSKKVDKKTFYSILTPFLGFRRRMLLRLCLPFYEQA